MLQVVGKTKSTNGFKNPLESSIALKSTGVYYIKIYMYIPFQCVLPCRLPEAGTVCLNINEYLSITDTVCQISIALIFLSPNRLFL